MTSTLQPQTCLTSRWNGYTLALCIALIVEACVVANELNLI